MDRLASEFAGTAENDRLYTVRFQISLESSEREALVQSIEAWSGSGRAIAASSMGLRAGSTPPP